MRKLSLLLALVSLISLTACGAGDRGTPQDRAPEAVGYQYAEDLSSFEDVLRYSSDVVKATLTATKDFDGSINVYTFRIDEDFTGNAPKEIHVYDQPNSAYLDGHTYYLFLCRGESALFPHTIFTTVLKELIVDVAEPKASATVNGSDLVLDVPSIPEEIQKALDSGVIAQRVEKMPELSSSAKLEEVAKEADLIAEICVSGESNANPNASAYQIQVKNMVKGEEKAMPAVLDLPPELDTGKSYYVLLKQDPAQAGSYLLFSRTYPVVGSTTSDGAYLAALPSGK